MLQSEIPDKVLTFAIFLFGGKSFMLLLAQAYCILSRIFLKYLEINTQQ